MKKLLLKLNLYLFASFVIVSCNKTANPAENTERANPQTGVSEMKIAYVEVDSLMTQYTFSKEKSLELEKKSNNARNTLAQKGKQLQNAAVNFQQKIQNNSFASREEAANAQAALQRQEQSLQELQNRLAAELDSETNKFNLALRDSLQNFLNDYNKDKKYDLILSKVGDNILYANAKYNITQDVINGLNKRYKKNK